MNYNHINNLRRHSQILTLILNKLSNIMFSIMVRYFDMII